MLRGGVVVVSLAALHVRDAPRDASGGGHHPSRVARPGTPVWPPRRHRLAPVPPSRRVLRTGSRPPARSGGDARGPRPSRPDPDSPARPSPPTHAPPKISPDGGSARSYTWPKLPG